MPARRDQPDPNAYQRHKDSARQRQAELARAGRDIGPLPQVADLDRRDRGRDSFRAFCESYFPDVFSLAWSDDHLRAIDKIEQAVLHGGLFAFAMPRGSGKTSLSLAAVLWSLLYGHRRFVVLVAASAEAAADLLDDLRAELEANDLLLDDFPEVCHPIRKLEGISNRCAGQLLDGQRTRISWTATELILPTVEGPPASGAIIRVAGVTGRIRGLKATCPADGRSLRPDFVIVDDPQTDESARSPSQCQKRLAVLNGAILGLAGPGQKIAGVMPCTVISAGDVADQVLDQDKSPEWQGSRFKMLYEFPANTKLWDQYGELRAESLRAGRGLADATAFYAANREAMDAGAVVAWPQRFNHDELSAIQSAMNLSLRDEPSFMAEYQNSPMQLHGDDAEVITADQAASKINGLSVGVVPQRCSRVVTFIDVQKRLLYYTVCAFADDFTGAVIAYGSYPDQGRRYFTLADAKKTIGRRHPGQTLEGQLFAALGGLCDDLLARTWVREDGQEFRISRCMIDAGWGESTAVVRAFCRQSQHAAVLLPSFGRAITADRKPISEYSRKPGDRFGHGWYVPADKSRHIIYDVLVWKTFVHQRLAMNVGDPGGLTIYGQKPAHHRMLAEQLTAEYAVPTRGNGRLVNVWKLRPGRDNNLFDTCVGCVVAASEQGVKAVGHDPDPEQSAKPRRRRRYNVSF